MKKPSLIALLSVGLAAVIFLVGMFVGRNSLSITPQPTRTFAASSAAEIPTTVHRLLNINTADIWQLQQLPGIGDVLAQRIVDYRRENGPFRSLEQLQDVEGIGRAKLETILELICLED